MAQTKLNKTATFFPTVLSDFFDSDKFFNNHWLSGDMSRVLPAVNIKENNNEFNIEFAAPGFSKNDFKINIEENMLTVSAEKKTEKDETKGHFTRKEFSYNSFSRSFNLPLSANANKMDAKYSDGILKLNIPKKEKARSVARKEIKIA